MPKCSFVTAGCKVNQYETCALREKFASEGFKEAAQGSPSDICVVNTCTVTEEAESKSRNLIRRALKMNPAARVIITGCLVERHNKPLPSSGRIEIMSNEEKQEAISGCKITKFAHHTRAFLKIQDGCDNFCSYCIVPYARGRSRCRGIKDVSPEAAALVKAGYKEIVLTGICLGAYEANKDGRGGLAEVIDALERLDGLARIRLSSIEPRYATGRLLEKMAVSRKLCRHLHIPFQSGDDEILARMNRPYTQKRYLEIVKKARAIMPDIAITTDIMVGFPGERDKNFNNTLDFLRKVSPARVHIFTFSRRAGAAASNFEGEVPAPVKKIRKMAIEKASRSSAYNYKKAYLNKVVDVLVEGIEDEAEGLVQGYTSNYIKVILNAPKRYINRIAPAKIIKITPDFAYGEITPDFAINKINITHLISNI